MRSLFQTLNAYPADRLSRLLGAFAAALFFASEARADNVTAPSPKETPQSMVDALHTAFGKHHARAVHTKGTMLEGTFTPAPEAKSIVKTPVFSGGTVPVLARFSLFAGLPDLPDNADAASPAGFAA